MNRTVLCHQLHLIGFHVDIAPDGQLAFERFTTGRYGLVLTDLNMPGLDGYELVAAIRRHEEACAPHPRPGAQRQRHAGGARALPGCRHGRLRGQADDRPLPQRQAAAVASPRGVARASGAGSAGAGGRGGARGSAAHPPIDDTVLAELTGGDAEVATAVLQDFVEASRADVEALEAALAAGDRDEVRRQAHRVKGASRLVGARRLADLGQELETLAEDPEGGIDELRRLAADLAAALSMVERAVV